MHVADATLSVTISTRVVTTSEPMLLRIKLKSPDGTTTYGTTNLLVTDSSTVRMPLSSSPTIIMPLHRMPFCPRRCPIPSVIDDRGPTLVL